MNAVLIAGPTASGKSAAALALSKRISGALINADSMQVYREARILTARPGDAEMKRAPHFLYGHVSVGEPYDAARYAADATRVLAEVRAMGRVPIFVGGTGLYFSALTQGLADMPRVPPDVREAARTRREAIGADAFHAELAARDCDSAARLRASDTQRVLRAYEVFEATGKPLSQWQKGAAQPVLGDAKLARFVLAPPRAELRARIDARFDAMLAQGALEEAKALAASGSAKSAAKIIGLRELMAAAEGKLPLEEAVRLAKTATHQYAKRQMTWFRNRMSDWTLIEETEIDAIVSAMVKLVPPPHEVRGTADVSAEAQRAKAEGGGRGE